MMAVKLYPLHWLISVLFQFYIASFGPFLWCCVWRSLKGALTERLLTDSKNGWISWSQWPKRIESRMKSNCESNFVTKEPCWAGKNTGERLSLRNPESGYRVWFLNLRVELCRFPQGPCRLLVRYPPKQSDMSLCVCPSNTVHWWRPSNPWTALFRPSNVWLISNLCFQI